MLVPADPATPETKLEALRTREERYKLGQFFTPSPIAELMGEAVREVSPATVLDPGVGGGVLLRAVGPGPKLFGIDVDPEAVALAKGELGEDSEISTGDFLAPLTWPLSASSFDAIISNPPYIRHHNLSVTHKGLAKHYSAVFGSKVSSLSGSYVYFFLEAIRRLNDGGRLVFITPTEFLDVRYGQAVKEALLNHCDINEILVLEMDELAFEGVLTTSAVTVATKRKTQTRRIRLVEGRLNGAVEKGRSVELPSSVAAPSLPWSPLLPSRVERIAPLVVGRTARLGDYCRVRRGIATGGNSFFCLTRNDVEEWGIEERFLVPVALGSKDLPAEGPLDEEFRQSRIEAGARAFLFFCHESEVKLAGTNALRYIEHGEALGLHEKFNCRTRSPWYGAEPVPPSDFFATYMSRDRARMVRNLVGARCMTSLLNIWAKPGVDPEALRPSLEDPTNAKLLREFGRTYGGGLGKIEPGDLLTLPIIPPEGVGVPGQARLL
jgi:adenine-specific DNA methylase